MAKFSHPQAPSNKYPFELQWSADFEYYRIPHTQEGKRHRRMESVNQNAAPQVPEVVGQVASARSKDSLQKAAWSTPTFTMLSGMETDGGGTFVPEASGGLLES
jgi:hypothetical protein